MPLLSVGPPGFDKRPNGLSTEVAGEKRTGEHAKYDPGHHPQKDVPWSDAHGKCRPSKETQYQNTRMFNLVLGHDPPPGFTPLGDCLRGDLPPQ